MAGEQFVKQHAQRVNIGPRINIEAGHERLLRTHVGGRANKLLEGGEDGFVGQRFSGGGFGDSEINHLGDSDPIVKRNQNI